MQGATPSLEVDTVQDQAILRLREVLGETPFFIFIDPTLGDPLAPDGALADTYVALHALGKVSKQKLPHIHDNFDPAKQLYVVHVNNQLDGERLLSASVRLACHEAGTQQSPDARTVCGWFSTGQAKVQVAAWLGAQAKVIRPDNQIGYLRFWDPRVVWQLPRALEPLHLARLQPLLSAWHYLDARLRLRCALGPVASPASLPLLGASPIGSLQQPAQRLAGPAWARLQQIEAVNRVYAAFADAPLEPDDETIRAIKNQFDRSAEAGFAGADDAVTFACAAMASHPRFSEHPAVKAALAGADSVAAALGDFDDMFWAQLREGSWLAHTASKASSL